MIVFLENMDEWIDEIRNLSNIEDPNEVFPDFEYENAYKIVGGNMNVWNVATSDSGKEYISSAVTYTPLNVEFAEALKLDNYFSSNEGVSAISFLTEADPVRNSDLSSGYIFKLTDFVDCLKSSEVLT